MSLKPFEILLVIGALATALLIWLTPWALVATVALMTTAFFLVKIEDKKITFWGVFWQVFPKGNNYMYLLYFSFSLIMPMLIFCFTYVLGLVIFGLSISMDTFIFHQSFATNVVSENETVMSFIGWGMNAAMILNMVLFGHTVASLNIDIADFFSKKDPRP